MFGLVGTISIHLHDGVIAPIDRPLEAVEVGRAQTGLARSVQDVDLLVGRGEAVGDLAGAVG